MSVSSEQNEFEIPREPAVSAEPARIADDAADSTPEASAEGDTDKGSEREQNGASDTAERSDALAPSTGGDDGTKPPLEVERVPMQTPADPSPLPDLDAEGAADFVAPEFFLNRELTWLNFNFRVLAQAEDDRTPLLERLKFVAIVSSNLDEFFMKRIGGLKQQVGAGLHDQTIDGRTPQQQIDECYELVGQLEQRKRAALLEIKGELEKLHVRIARWRDLNDEQKEYLRNYYIDNIYPLVTPQAIDPAHPFPFISNLSINLLVQLRYKDATIPSLARVKVPVGVGIPRMLKLEGENTFVRMESVMAHNLDLLFPGMEIDSIAMFRVTRNANTERAEERADDLLALIETELRDRRFAPIVRLEVAEDMDPNLRALLTAELGLDPSGVSPVEGMLGMRDLMELMSLREQEEFVGPELQDPTHHPIDHPELTSDRSIFHVIRDAGSLLLQLPYEAFSTSVERLLREASQDPKVRAIKMTVYRTSARSKVIQHLIEAAENGKQVAVVVELKARFDEEANIRWANRLEDAGIHVTYGVVGLKTHCKAILVVRRDYSGLRRYVHIGTGNYNGDTARLYTDLGLFTADPEIGKDLTELFNYLTTGYRPKRDYHKLLPAPKHCKAALLRKIDREILHVEQGRTGRIQSKTNALEDADLTRAL